MMPTTRRRPSLPGAVFRATLLSATLLVAGSALASDPPQSAAEWIEWANEARERNSFIGEFVYRHGNDIETMKIWRAADPESGIRERLISLSGDPREILRGDDSVTCILGNSQSVLVDRRQLRRPLSARIPEDVERLRPHYRLQLVGEDRVAGRRAMQITLEPQDDLRYGYSVWLDHETGLMTRAEVIDPDNQVIEQLMMLDIDPREQIDPVLLEPTLSGEGAEYTLVTSDLARANAVPDADSREEWAMEEQLAGFAVQMNRMQQLPGRPHPVRHLMLSDGLATISVYIEPEGQAEGFEGGMQMGAMNAYGRTSDGYQAIVVGEVPAATVERIAHSLVPNNDTSQPGQ